MFLTTAVDVAIGLILTYLLLGLIISAFLEIVAKAMKLRGQFLFNGLAQMSRATGRLISPPIRSSCASHRIR
jgi:hypothetical protein